MRSHKVKITENEKENENGNVQRNVRSDEMQKIHP